MFRGISVLILLVVGFSSSASFACSGPTSPEQSYTQDLADQSDYIMFATVSHVTRRRWTDDDVPPKGIAELRALRDKGRFILRRQRKYIDFSDAAVWVRPFLPIKTPDDVAEDADWASFFRQNLPVDMFHSGRARSVNTCEQIPNVCDWDAQPGDFIILALQSPPHIPLRSLVCYDAYPIPTEMRPDLIAAASVLDKGEFLFVTYLEGLRKQTRDTLGDMVQFPPHLTKSGQVHTSFWVEYVEMVRGERTKGDVSEDVYRRVFADLRAIYRF